MLGKVWRKYSGVYTQTGCWIVGSVSSSIVKEKTQSAILPKGSNEREREQDSKN